MPALTQLDHFRLLGKSGLRVSPLSLGTMTFGEDWGWGSPKETSQAIFQAYVEKGGNFIDTANFYTNGSSETLLGEFMQGQRERIVLTTKFTLNPRLGDPNSGGNHRKNIVQSVEASLKRLQSEYIDLYYVHVWEYRTPVEETMRALDDLVRAGKVLYLGISDAPAWKVAQANTVAELRGWTAFIGLQVEYSLIEREVERDLVPMSQELGLGVIPWAPLNAGVLTGKYNPIDGVQAGENKRNISDQLDDRKRAISVKVQEIAKEIGRTPAQVAINWLMQQPNVTSPIIGARTFTQLEDNLGALEFTLEADHLRALNEVSAITLGFPHGMIEGEMVQRLVSGGASIEERYPQRGR
jgi:aryl-alcohol dehydrogenase-like predicted oxidoreductase